MKNLLLSIVLLLLASSGEVVSQSWHELMDSSSYYQSKQDYQTALKWALQAEVKGKEEFEEMDTNYVNSIILVCLNYYNIGNFEKSIEYGEKVKSIIKELKGDKSPEYARVIGTLGAYYNNNGNYDKAESLLKEALDLERLFYKGDNPLLAQSINNMAAFYYGIGKYIEAESLLIESLEMRRRIFKGDNSNLALSISNLGVFYKRRGDYIKAESMYKEALEMNRRIFKSDHPNLANTINNMATFYLSRGKYKEAESLYKEALSMRRRIFKGDNPDLAGVINNLALFYYETGNYNEAEPLFREALEMRGRIFKSDHPDLAESINDMGYFYDGLGNYKEVEFYYKEALEMRRRIYKTDNPDLARSLSNMATLYTTIGNYIAAEPMFKEALEMRRRIFKTDNPELAQSIENMACFNDYIGKYQESEPLHLEALEMRRRIFKTDHQNVALSLNNMALFYYNVGKYEEAELMFKEALEMRRRIFKSVHPDVIESLYHLASFYNSKRDYENAEPLFIELFSIAEKIITDYFHFLSEIEKDRFVSMGFKYYKSYLSYLVNIKINSNNLLDTLYLNSLNQEYNNLLFTKGMILNSNNKMKNQIVNCGDSSLLDLYNSLRYKREYISKLYKLTNQELEDKKINFDSVLNSANIIEKELSRKSDNFTNDNDDRIIRWTDIYKVLKKNEASIEIVRFNYFDGKKFTDSVIYGALILKSLEVYNPIDFILLNNGNELEQLQIKNYQNCIKNRLLDYESYNHFWAKINEKLKGVKKVFLSPDGIYNKINLATLYNPKTKKYLLEEMEVQVITSTRDLVVNKEKKKPEYNNTAVLIGNPRFNLDKTEYKKVSTSLENKFKTDYFINEETELSMRSGILPLPGTGIEIDKISRLLKNKNWKVEKYTDNLAIEEVVKKIQNPRILHIATHGKFLSDNELNYTIFNSDFNRQRKMDNPLLSSYLIFAGADSPDTIKSSELDDGFLTAYEAQNLYLDKTELVVLSACETGLGEIRNGEGVYGLQRAFIQAGARSLIMSLWSVSDEATQELMVSFYQKWLSGKTKRQAFREAQQELKTKYPQPYYWGAFVMVGE
jgi:CHAT domain-containing protein/tetratricopeptide (TPR) repeat protein